MPRHGWRVKAAASTSQNLHNNSYSTLAAENLRESGHISSLFPYHLLLVMILLIWYYENNQNTLNKNARKRCNKMLTYNLTNADGPLYKCLYECIKNDIAQGKLESGEKMPSKRTLAKNLGVSTITVENAYDQLIGEGYMYAMPKRGYFIADVSDIRVVKAPVHREVDIKMPPQQDENVFDFSSNRTDSNNFPFSIWAKLMRETISLREKDLLRVSPCGGVFELRQAIANHLASFRGMNVDPDQIIVGAGTEYLYGLIVKLLGKDRVYCVEDPGYKKISQIYECNNARCVPVQMDEQGINVDLIKKANAQIAHISPTHHFPTGITMPVNRRYELLAWANESDDRYIIEDDYDSEFRLNGRPIPPILSIDACEKVIYINTFSKSLTSTIRISYMVLPEHLANEFYRRLSFYACTVSTFEQYTLARFISEGYFEKHINRTRLHYGRKRQRVLESIRKCFKDDECKVIENDSGLHFIIQLDTKMPDSAVEQALLKKHIKLQAVTDFNINKKKKDRHQFIINYSNIDMDRLGTSLAEIRRLIVLKDR